MSRWTSVLFAVGGLTAFPLLDSAIRGTLILVLAGTVCVWLRRDSAATRHFVWTIAVFLLVAMPVLSLVLPQWRILPNWMNSTPVTLQHISSPESPTVVTLVEADAIFEPPQPIIFEDLPAVIRDDASDVMNAATPEPNNGSSDVAPAIGPMKESATQMPAWISAGWLIGCVLLIVRLSIAAVMLRWSERRCVVVRCCKCDKIGSESPESMVQPLASGMHQLPGPARVASRVSDTEVEYRPVDTGRSPQELGIALEQSKLALGLKRPVAILLDPKRSIPIVWGLWETRLQLPKEALQWNDEQLQSVLLHELAHVRRRDLFVLALTQIACALHWFNPLVWIAAWRMHLERERACDDLVLNTGIRASSYAEHLLNVATRLTSSQWTQACGLAMARNSSLHGRLSAVLREKQNRRSVTTALAIGLVLTATILAAPMAMLRGSDDAQQGNSKTGAGLFNQIGEKPIPFTEAFDDLAWGEFHESDLRAAVVIDSEGDSVPLGTVVQRKLILHNRGEKPVRIRLAFVHHHQLSHVVAGRPVIIDYKPTRLPYETEVPPNSCIGLDASGIGFGDDLTETQQQQIPFLQRVSAVAGDSFSTSAEIRLLIGRQPDNVLSLEKVNVKTGEVKLHILPWLPDAPRKVRTADTPGNYIVAENLRLYIDHDTNETGLYKARLVYSKSEPWDAKPLEEPVWESEEIAITWPFQFVWIRHSGTVWLAESSGIRKLTYAEKAKVQDVDEQELQSLPERLREYLDPSLERFRNQSRPQNPGSPVPVSMPEGLEQLLDWSEPVNGLRAAVAIRTSLTDNAPGKDLRILVAVHNISEDTIRFCPATKHESRNRSSIFLQSMGLSFGGYHFAPSDFPPKIEATIPPHKVFWFDFLAHQQEYLPDEEHRELCEQLIQQLLDHSHQTLSVSLQVHDAPEGAWKGTLSTPPTRGGLGTQPSGFPDALCDQLYAGYLASAQRNHDSPGDIPSSLITELRDVVQQFIGENKDNPSTVLQVKQFELLVERFDSTGDWKQDEVIALLHDIASISTVPLKRASEKTVAPPAIGTVSMYAPATLVEIEPTDSGNEPAVPPAERVLRGDTVVATVNGKRITVDDVLCGGRQMIEAHTSVEEKVRASVIRKSVQMRLAKYVDDELVMQELESRTPQNQREVIRESLEPSFTQFLERIRKNNLLETDEELAAKLASQWTTISSLREQFLRSQLTEGYLSKVAKVPEKVTPDELRKYYEEHQDDYAVWKESDSENTRVTRTIQSFEEAQAKVEWDLRLRWREEARKKVVEEIRRRSSVEIFVKLELD